MDFSEYHRQQDEAIESAEPYPMNRFEGRGIVTCAGGPRLFTCAWVLIRVLREIVRTPLPVQLWYLGGQEMDCDMRRLLEKQDVEVVDAYEVDPTRPPPSGWAFKTFAIKHSRFEELVFLDADNVPVVDPSELFESLQYRQTGAVFWPDIQPLPAHSPIWELCRVHPRVEPSFESGQIVLDKARCWDPLLLAKHMNDRADFYYRFFYGDKDTFHMAWHMLDRPYAMPPYPARLLRADLSKESQFFFESWILEQSDFAGKIAFQHRNFPKFVLFGKNPHYPEFLYEKECLCFLDELAHQWTGRVSGFQPQLPVRGSQSRGARWFRYVQVSSGERLIELRPDQTIGHGSSASERRWRVILEGGVSVLELIGERYTTCQLQHQQDGVWRGRWLRFERMPVELIPCVTDGIARP